MKQVYTTIGLRALKLGICIVSLVSSSLEAAYTLRDGKIVNTAELATMSVQEHHSAALLALEAKNWDELLHQGIVITKNFPATPFAKEAFFFLGAAYFHLGKYESANHNLNLYLKKQGAPKHFEQAITYKFEIADDFRKGAKKHLMGWEVLPKWVPAKDEALAIYDEVITALPHHDLAARALFGKGSLLTDLQEYRQAIETFQGLIRRFPRHYLSPESYLEIEQIYSKQSRAEFPDPDFLDLAEINLRKFRQEFPGEERLEKAQLVFEAMQEFYASSLYDTGQFFERTKKKQAALIYYSKIMTKYPSTQIAKKARKRIQEIRPEKE